MPKKLCKICFVGLLMIFLPNYRTASLPGQGENILPNNSCVVCHSKITAPLALSNRYFDWHVSAHRDHSIGCDQCHGGDPTAKDQSKAHQQVVRPAKDAQSKVNPANMPETCRTCHSEVVKSFVGSRHYQKLKESALGPTCTTCHEHMASSVAQTPTGAAALCARCHNTVGGPLPARPEIPEKAQQVMESLTRANAMMVWADRLVEVGQQKKMDLSAEVDQLKVAQAALAEAQANWHALSFDVVVKKANESFDTASKAKDGLMAKLYPPPK